ncbi:MAG: hypothetical protein V2A77_11485 [Pseudomonadota bacterium]
MDPEEWLKANKVNMLACPKQPGNLKISRNSCAQRFESANSKRIDSLPETTDYFFALKENFKACKECSIGEDNYVSIYPADECLPA